LDKVFCWLDIGIGKEKQEVDWYWIVTAFQRFRILAIFGLSGFLDMIDI